MLRRTGSPRYITKVRAHLGTLLSCGCCAGRSFQSPARLWAATLAALRGDPPDELAVFQLAEVAVPRALVAEILRGIVGSGRGHFRRDGEALGVSITTGEVRPETAPWGPRCLGPRYRGAEKQRGAPRITSSGPQGLVARAHGEQNGTVEPTSGESRIRGAGIRGLRS
jgi:hypothetical protein